jgi:hypothetical protein
MRRLIAWPLVLVAWGCEADRHVDVFVDADPCGLEGGATVAIEVRDAQETVVETFTTTPDALPAGIRLRPGSDGARWHVVATLSTSDGVPIGFQSARGGYPETGSLERGILFHDSCLGIECGEGETCIDAKCVSDTEIERVPRHEPRELCPPIVFVDVATGADEDGCGAFASPCASIQPAIDDHVEAQRGAVIHVKEGTYLSNGDRVYFVAFNGDPDADPPGHQLGGSLSPIVLKRWPGFDRPLVDANDVSVLGFALHGSHLVLHGFRVRGGIAHGISINGSHISDVTVRECEAFENGRGYPPVPEPCAVPEDCRPGRCIAAICVHSYDDRGGLVVNNNASDVLIERSVFRDNSTLVLVPATGGPEYASGIRVNMSRRVVIRDCELRSNQRVGLYLSGGDGLEVTGSRLVGNGEIGIRNGGTDLLLARSVVCESGGPGLLVSGSQQATVRGSTIVASASHAIDLSGPTALLAEGNIFAFNGDAAIVTDDSRTAVDDRFNLYFDNDPDGITRDMPETDLVDVDPRFADLEACDLTLASDSPARGAGPGGTDLGAP